MPLATDTSTSSPMSWPKVSLTSLNRSRSRNSTATRSEVRCARISAVSSRSRSSRRFGRLVRLSCRAACSSIRSVLRRLVASSRQTSVAPGPASGISTVVTTAHRSWPRACRSRRSVVPIRSRPMSSGATWSCSWLPTSVGRRVPEVAAQRVVDLDHPAGAVDHRHRHRVALEDRPELAAGRLPAGHAGGGRGIGRAPLDVVVGQRPSPLAETYPPVTERSKKPDPPRVTPTARESRPGKV